MPPFFRHGVFNVAYIPSLLPPTIDPTLGEAIFSPVAPSRCGRLEMFDKIDEFSGLGDSPSNQSPEWES